MSTELTKESLMVQVATLALQSVSANEIHKRLNISRHAVRKIQNSPEYAEYLSDMNRQASQNALAHLKSKLDELAPLAFAALKKNLEDGKIEGVKVFMELTGAKEKAEEKQQDAVFQIVMPGAVAPAIEVKSEVVSEEA